MQQRLQVRLFSDRRQIMAFVCVAMALFIQACAEPLDRAPVPLRLVNDVHVVGMPSGIRAWGDGGDKAGAVFIAAERDNLRKKYAVRGKGHVPAAHFLALSGGADDGAFGAGLLVGWSAKGTRPEFDLVTGISAGALIAPFAFIGRDYDRQLAEIYTVHDGRSIYSAKILSGVFGGPAVADNAPLAALIAKYVDQRMMARIAEERAKGRVLLIGTTNLDAQRPVFWDIGRIAMKGDEAALVLFRKILLASAALPGVFPPVEIDVTIEGKRYQETHVDGGPTRQVFLTPGDFSFTDVDKAIGIRVKRHVWVVRNSKILPEYGVVELKALSIGERSLGMLTKYQGIGDLNRIYDRARADNLDFNLASIPMEFNAQRQQPFDMAYMQALYKVGFNLGRDGNPWEKSIPTPPQGSLR